MPFINVTLLWFPLFFQNWKSCGLKFFHVVQIIFSSRYCTVWGRSPRVKFGCQSQSQRMSQPDPSPPPSGRGTCPRPRGCCACWAAPCVSPPWLLRGSSPVKRDLLPETSPCWKLHTPSPSLLPEECYFGEKRHGQLERAKVVLLVIFLFSPIINASNLLQLLPAKQK